MTVYQAFTADFPDPCVVFDTSTDTYHAYATQGSGINNCQHRTSTDLVTWSDPDEAIPVLPLWTTMGWTWAPEVFYFDGHWIMYVTMSHWIFNQQQIAVGVSDTPGGPFTFNTVPIVTSQQSNGCIDPSPFIDPTGRPWLFYMAGNRTPNAAIWAVRLRCKGLAVTGHHTQVMEKTETWEGAQIEGPSVVYHNNQYYLFYSANLFNEETYSIGYCTAPRVLGTYTKQTVDAAWVASTASYSAPGGQNFFTDADNNLRMAFHAWLPGTVGTGNRSLWIGSVDLDSMTLS